VNTAPTKSEYSVAVVGATGLVGETLIQVLEERDFPVSQLYALASNRSLGKSLVYKGRNVRVEELEGFDFSKADIGLFSPAPRCPGYTRPRPPPPAASSSTTLPNSGTRMTFRWWCPR
jgi:aspartate-semialdehyde dehydrogenase